MKKGVCFALILITLSLSNAFGQIRFELGAVAPLGVGTIAGTDSNFLADTFADVGIIPVPTAGLYLQGDLGAVKIGAGVKLYSLIVATAGYPNLLMEIDLGRFALEAGLGGYYVGLYEAGATPVFEQADVLFPEISAWVALGKRRNFRIGAGAVGMISDFNLEEIPFLYYAGLKVVLD